MSNKTTMFHREKGFIEVDLETLAAADWRYFLCATPDLVESGFQDLLDEKYLSLIEKGVFPSVAFLECGFDLMEKISENDNK